jgi:hypothetical protein
MLNRDKTENFGSSSSYNNRRRLRYDEVEKCSNILQLLAQTFEYYFRFKYIFTAKKKVAVFVLPIVSQDDIIS